MMPDDADKLAFRPTGRFGGRGVAAHQFAERAGVDLHIVVGLRIKIVIVVLNRHDGLRRPNSRGSG